MVPRHTLLWSADSLSQNMQTFRTAALHGTLLIASATSLTRRYTRGRLIRGSRIFGHFLTAKKEGQLICGSTCFPRFCGGRICFSISVQKFMSPFHLCWNHDLVYVSELLDTSYSDLQLLWAIQLKKQKIFRYALTTWCTCFQKAFDIDGQWTCS